MKILTALLLLIGSFLTLKAQGGNDVEVWTDSLDISTNSWSFANEAYQSQVPSAYYQSSQGSWHCFVKVARPTELNLALKASVQKGNGSLEVEVLGVKQTLNLTESTSLYRLKSVQVKEGCYVKISLRGAPQSELKLQQLFLSGSPSVKLDYIRDEPYWGRRGPSVHLSYSHPVQAMDSVSWYYSELEVPKGQDVVGSYFMANGFSVGYFGIQVNSPEERRILFSVWSPHHTDNPAEVPKEARIQMLRKGEDVYTGKFGNEGSGGQSFKKFTWKAATTYGFLLGAKPNGDNTTNFTAYFYNPVQKQWMLIAEFQRPQTSVYVELMHSFLENFSPEQGIYSRLAHYKNQWAYRKGKWWELTQAYFTADNTARKSNRKDYAGGSLGSYFYLKNCGFFNNTVDYNQMFQRKPTGIEPRIDFRALP